MPPPEHSRRAGPPLPRRPEPPRHEFAYERRPGLLARSTRGLAGVFTAGFVVMTLALIGAQIWSTSWGQEGPGTAALTSHIIAAAVAIICQAIGDRDYTRRGNLATLVVYAAVLGSLWFWWW